MASIVKRNLSYTVVYYYKDKHNMRKQKWETFKTLEEAEKRKRIIETGISLHISVIHTFQDLVTEFIDIYGKTKWSYSTFSSNLAILNSYILKHLGPLYLTSITPRLLEQYFKVIKNEVPPNTILKIHKLLKSIFKRAYIWEYIEKNPVEMIVLPKISTKQRCILSIEQISTLLESCKDDFILSLCIQLAFACSLRKGEILALTWNDIDFDRGKLHITKELSRIDKTLIDELNRNDILYIFPSKTTIPTKTTLVLKSPKTQTSVRDVYIPKTLLAQLALYYQQTKHTKNYLTPDYPLVFSDSYGYPLTDKVINDRLRKHLLLCDLPLVVFHSLRHSSVTYKLLITHGDIKSIQGDTGHSQVKMITDVYSHILDSGRKNVADLFEYSFYTKNSPTIY
ncbi:MAG: tyrosine-type recombinase/integrase [Eubacteriales bacterium]|nr:tyrosine-type recombinase/integrase [Eubacteriales bacterium]